MDNFSGSFIWGHWIFKLALNLYDTCYTNVSENCPKGSAQLRVANVFYDNYEGVNMLVINLCYHCNKHIIYSKTLSPTKTPTIELLCITLLHQYESLHTNANDNLKSCILNITKARKSLEVAVHHV